MYMEFKKFKLNLCYCNQVGTKLTFQHLSVFNFLTYELLICVFRVLMDQECKKQFAILFTKVSFDLLAFQTFYLNAGENEGSVFCI